MANFNFFLNRQGVRGNKGEQGEQGYSPRITVKTETAAEYVLNVQNEDGSFDTPNLRGNAIENLGGTYIRFNQDTEQMYTGYADTASTTSQGEVVLSTYEDLASGGYESEVTTSKDVHDFVEAKISEASINYVDIDDYTQKMSELDGEISNLDNNKLDFTDLLSALVAGTNITITPNTQTGKITIAGEPVDQAQADWNQDDTDAPDYIKNKPTIPESITVDSELSATSTNPVQNRLITNAINLISNEFENYATNKLDNLSNEGEARLHALKAYSDNGELLTDAEGLADVTNYAHSSFDRSKFTVVGSPNITDDGILINTTSVNGYVKKDITFESTDTVRLKCKMQWNYPTSEVGVINLYNAPRLSIAPSGGMAIRTGLGTWVGWGIKENAVNDGEWIELDMTVKSNYLSIITTKEDGTQLTFTNTTNTFDLGSVQNFTIAYMVSNTYIWTNAVVDLKYTELYVNGVPVFSGNKTGIDTIKPDDYTVVGTPTISADGVASGFVSQTNYITGSFAPVSAKNKVELWGAITNNSADTNGSVICATNGNLRIAKTSANVIGIRGLLGGLVVNSPNLSLQDGDFVIAHAIATTTEATLQTWVNGVKQPDVTVSGDFSAIATSYDSLYIGGQYSNGNYSPASDIDMNYCKVLIDTNLVYQPCLKIPYAKGSEQYGGKYVNAQYLPRVKDAYKQGLANDYFTLDEVNGTYTLPMGNLYGMIEKINGEIGDVESILNSINSGNGGQ